MTYVHLNGQLLDSTKATISPSDQGFLTGHGIFETIRVEAGKVCHLDLHYDRFKKSAAVLALYPPTLTDLKGYLADLIDQNKLTDARIRITLSGGSSPFPEVSAESTLLISSAPLPRYSETASIITVPYLRNENSALSGIKTLSYSENLIALREAKAQGADEAIFANSKGQLCEGATTNIFLIRDGQLITLRSHLDAYPEPCATRFSIFAKRRK